MLSGLHKTLQKNSFGYIFNIDILITQYIMPNLDKTGPAGKGPQTGRRRGACGGGEVRENGQAGCGQQRGQGRGRGNGRGCGQQGQQEA